MEMRTFTLKNQKIVSLLNQTLSDIWNVVQYLTLVRQ